MLRVLDARLARRPEEVLKEVVSAMLFRYEERRVHKEALRAAYDRDPEAVRRTKRILPAVWWTIAGWLVVGSNASEAQTP